MLGRRHRESQCHDRSVAVDGPLRLPVPRRRLAVAVTARPWSSRAGTPAPVVAGIPVSVLGCAPWLPSLIRRPDGATEVVLRSTGSKPVGGARASTSGSSSVASKKAVDRPAAARRSRTTANRGSVLLGVGGGEGRPPPPPCRPRCSIKGSAASEALWRACSAYLSAPGRSPTARDHQTSPMSAGVDPPGRPTDSYRALASSSQRRHEVRSPSRRVAPARPMRAAVRANCRTGGDGIGEQLLRDHVISQPGLKRGQPDQPHRFEVRHSGRPARDDRALRRQRSQR